MRSSAFVLSVTCAVLASFLFGFHSGVISFSLPLIVQDFTLTSKESQLCVAVLLLGAMAGALLCQPLADHLGRKKSLVIVGAIFSVTTLWMVLSKEWLSFIFARLFCGIATGLASTLPPMYIAEIAPPSKRGRFVSFHQLMVAFGIFFSYITSYVLSSSNSWQKMLSVGIVFSTPQLISACFAMESPLWMQRLRLSGQWKIAVWTLVKNKKHRMRLFIAIVLNIIQQISGINTVIYYTPVLLNNIGIMKVELALMVAAVTGLVSTIATALSSLFVDYVGRKWLLIFSLMGMAIALAFLVICLQTSLKTHAMLGALSIIAYTAFFAIGTGPVIVLLTSELFPSSCRAFCVSLATLSNWICNFLLSLYFLTISSHLGIGTLFMLFSFVCIAATLFVTWQVPETKGKKIH